jgi:hypothetical protein
MSVPRLLVAVLEGVGRTDITPVLTPFLAETLAELGSAPIHRTTPAKPCHELLAWDLARALRHLGLDVEQRSIALRPTWRSDATVARELDRRPAGAADITLLHLVDVAVAAARDGDQSDGHLQALTILDEHVSYAAGLLRRQGLAAKLAVLCIGPMLTAVRTFDPVKCLRSLPGPLRRQIRWQMEPGALRLQCSSAQTEAYLRGVLQGPPFCGHSSLVSRELEARILRPGELLLLPGDQVAFGRNRIRALLPYLPSDSAADGVAMLPWPERGQNSATIPEIAAHVLMDGAAMAHALGRGLLSTAAPDPAAEIQTVVDHDSFEMIED